MDSSLTKKIAFSIRPWENVGFTDQLLQFSAFYKLGRSLGWVYHHRDFTNHRSSTSIYDYLGFNEYMQFISQCFKGDDWENPEFGDTPMPLSDTELEQEDVRSFEDLQKFVRRKADGLLETSDSPSGRTLSLSLEKGSSRKFFAMIERAIRDLPDQVDFSTYFQESRLSHRAPRPLGDRPLKVVFHMRLGDTAFLKTPWDSFIFREFSQGVYRKPVQKETLDKQQFIEPSDYLKVTQSLLSLFPAGYVSSAFFSDGYARLFQEALANSAFLGLSECQVADLQELRHSYDQTQFAEFSAIESGSLFIGERDEYLFKLVEAILTADLIVMGRVQRMIPKFFAVYANKNSPRNVLVIGRDQRHPNYAGLGLEDGRKANFAGISIANDHLDESVHSAIERLIPKLKGEGMLRNPSQ